MVRCCVGADLPHNQTGRCFMDRYIIHGGTTLSGEVEISGAKNAAVAIIPAACAGRLPH